ncbi:unnamed protein product [Hymenolepis diminuta]|uniref:Uncharacterized protein n=1 Tax=Hymenolepis diminuta TaxID=6216 RepID=A0A564Z4J3_HYMDI|nr:unnamed protein product [Hymenolepis diminuta]
MFLPYGTSQMRMFKPDRIHREHLDRYSNKYTNTQMRLDILFSWYLLRKFPRQTTASRHVGGAFHVLFEVNYSEDGLSLYSYPPPSPKTSPVSCDTGFRIS